MSKARGHRRAHKDSVDLTNRPNCLPKRETMASILQVKPITDVPAHLRKSAQPQDPAFYQNPYPFYAEQHAASPAFFWEEYGHWCFADFKTVSLLMRDKRFGRDILHV